jgi:hypothetical protein
VWGIEKDQIPSEGRKFKKRELRKGVLLLCQAADKAEMKND